MWVLAARTNHHNDMLHITKNSRNIANKKHSNLTLILYS